MRCDRHILFFVKMFGMTFEIEYEIMNDARIPFSLLPLEHLERITFFGLNIWV